MEFKDQLVLDFARRTQANLTFIDDYVAMHPDEPDIQVYEVTQLINSLLGLLVFPEQKLYESIPDTPLEDLVKYEGFPVITPAYGKLQKDTLRQLLRYLRNGISHFHVKFISDNKRQICGIEVWNVPTHKIEPDWGTKLSLEQLRAIIQHFVKFLNKYLDGSLHYG